MNLVDSSGWLEYFAGSALADNYAQAIESTDSLLVSVINLYEVYKKIKGEAGESDALKAAAVMQQGKIQPITLPISLDAATLSHAHRLPMADSLIYATARQYQAVIYTQDTDFDNLAGVKYFPRERL